MAPMVFRKYKNNRRLYDPSRKRYVNLEEVETMVRRKKDVRVVDAQSGRDLTNSVLLQIILNRAKGGPASFLPTDFLAQLIQYQGKNVTDFYKNVLKVGAEYLGHFQRGMGDTRKVIESAIDGLGLGGLKERRVSRKEALFEELQRLKFKLAGIEKEVKGKKRGRG